MPGTSLCRRGGYTRIDINATMSAPWSPAEYGVWTDVTPSFSPALDSGGDDFGVQDVLVDPARPSDIYAFVCLRGVYKSTDYGTTWNLVSTGTNSSRFVAGKPWGAAIDPNVARNPATAPTLWSMAGNSSPFGFLRSTDGGVNWTEISVPTASQDVYCVDVNPYNSNHLIASFHDTGNVIESTDGGSTWTNRGDAGAGISGYVFFIDTGNSSTTAQTWLCVSQDGTGTGTYRTTNGGSSWSNVASFAHYHGCSQMAYLGAGHYMIGAAGGVFETTNSGATWNNVSTTEANGAIATPNNIYTSFGWASAPGWAALNLQHRAVSGGSWTSDSAPSGVVQVNGSKRMAVTSYSGRYAVISGNWNAGIWRYVET